MNDTSTSDWKLLLVVFALSTPFAALAAVWIYGSLGQFWDAWRGTSSTLSESVPGEAPPPRTSHDGHGPRRVRTFWIIYALCVVAAYAICRFTFPAAGRLLGGW